MHIPPHPASDKGFERKKNPARNGGKADIRMKNVEGKGDTVNESMQANPL
jgi:hypothetical protein